MKNNALKKVLGAFAFGCLVFGFSTLVTPTNGFSQTKSGENESGEKFYDFSGDDIDGELVRPDGDFIDPANLVEHTSLIKIRTDFIKEIIKSAEDL